MRTLSLAELDLVSGGDEPADLGEIVVTGPQRMTSDQIRDILAQYYSDQGGYSGGGYSGGGGGGGVANPPPPVIHVQEADTDGDGKIDTLWIDNDGDGYIGAGDGAAFISDGPWASLNSFQMNSVMQGLAGWLGEKGFEASAALGAAYLGSQVTGEAAGTALIRTGAGIVAPFELSWMMHELLGATLGGIDFNQTNEIQAAGYANYFGVYNPYTGGTGGGGGGGGDGGEGGDGPGSPGGTGGGYGDIPAYVN